MYRQLVFVYENVSDCLRKNVSKTFKALVPFMVIQGIQFIGINLPSFHQESSIHYFLSQMTFNIIVLKLMLANMTRDSFSPLHFAYMYMIIPQIAYFYLGVDAKTEILITRICLIVATLEFLSIVFRLSKQYIKFAKINFFFLKVKQ